MKWEPVENASLILERGEVVFGFIEFREGESLESDFDFCEYDGELLLPYNYEKWFNCDEYEVTHFMVIEEPNNENTNQAS